MFEIAFDLLSKISPIVNLVIGVLIGILVFKVLLWVFNKIWWRVMLRTGWAFKMLHSDCMYWLPKLSYEELRDFAAKAAVMAPLLEAYANLEGQRRWNARKGSPRSHRQF